MDYSTAVGQEVLSRDERKGKITKVSDSGCVTIKMDDGGFGDGGYLYDPFINEDFKFVDPVWQGKVEAVLAEIQKEAEDLKKKVCVPEEEEADFYITKDCEKCKPETVLRIKGTVQEAEFLFGCVIKEQQKEFRSGKMEKWRVVRLFDAKTGNQLAQES